MMRWPSSSWIETWTILQMRWRRRRKSPNQGNKARCGADVVRFSGRSANHTSVSGTADGAVSGGFLGSLTGLIFLNAAAGAASGALTDVGINEHFMKELSATLSPGSSTLFRAAKKSHAGQGQGSKNILVSLPSLSAVANPFGFTADFPGQYSSAKPFTSLLSKARDFLRGPISFTGVNARKENLITALSAPWPSSGYALSSPAGRPTNLTTNPSMSTPWQNEILPFPRLDGPPQTLEGTDA